MRVLLLNRVISASACLIALSIWGCVSPGELENPEDYKAALGTAAGTTAPSPVTGAGAPAAGAPAGQAAGMGGAPASTATGCANACQILSTKCAVCHGGPTGMGMGFDVASPNIGMRLSGMDAKTVDCLGEKLIDTVTPDNSVVYTKLLANDPPRCGQLMPPPGLPALTPEEIECVRQWVAKPVCP
jgi:hypothetical protein